MPFRRWGLCGLLFAVCFTRIWALSTRLSEEECEAGGKQIASLLARRNAEAVADMFDLGANFELITDGLEMEERRKGPFRERYRSTVLRSLKTILRQCDSTRYIRVQWVDGEKRVLIRVQDNETGSYNYLGFTLTRDEYSGGIKIIDLYDYLAGETLSQTTRGILTAMLAVEKQAIEERKPELMETHLEIMERVDEADDLIHANRNKEALEILTSLPDSWKKQRHILVLRFIASQHDDHGACQKVAQDWAQAFPGDSSLDMVCMRSDELLKKYDDAIRHVDALLEKLEEDPYLILRKAELCFKNNDFTGAKDTAWKALQKDPDLDPAWRTLIQSALLAQDHEATFLLVRKFRRKFSPDSLTRVIGSEPRCQEAFKEFSEYLKSNGKESFSGN